MYLKKPPNADINHIGRIVRARLAWQNGCHIDIRAGRLVWVLAESTVSAMELVAEEQKAPPGEDVFVNVRFSIRGGIRDAFNEEAWTRAYEKYDNTFKMKYSIKLQSGGFKKRTLGNPVDTYRKAAIFWTRNPKLVNPMKEKRVWVQVAKNFEPIIRLSEEEVRAELFDFDERVYFKAAELGPGAHKVSAEVSASWHKHDYTESGSVKGRSDETEIRIN